MCQKSLSGHIRLSCKKLIAGRTNRIVMHTLRHSCPIALLYHNLLSGQIKSHCKTLTTNRTNRIAMPLRCCVMRRCQDKSDHISIETCNVFYCAAVSSSDIFETQQFQLCARKKIGAKYKCNTLCELSTFKCSPALVLKCRLDMPIYGKFVSNEHVK